MFKFVCFKIHKKGRQHAEQKSSSKEITRRVITYLICESVDFEH